MNTRHAEHCDRMVGSSKCTCGARKRAHSFDPKCRELAEYFCPDAPGDLLDELAQEFQDVVEGRFDVE